MKTRFELIEDAYNDLLDKILDSDDADDMVDLVVEYKGINGESLRFSWGDREKSLQEREKGGNG